MKKLIIILGISLALSACGKSPAVKTGSEISDTPEWVQTMGLYKKAEEPLEVHPSQDSVHRFSERTPLCLPAMLWLKTLISKSKVPLAKLVSA